MNRRFFSLQNNGVFLEGSIVTHDSSTMIEIYGDGDQEPSSSPISLHNFSDEAEFVELLRQILNLDRVMVYRFTDNEDGEVIAESHITGIGSYLNHRYPASDVPMVARRLYLINPWRTIRDRDGEAMPIASIGQSPPDLTYSDVRSISPYHIDYMKAMGTYTSLSIPIAVDGRLWGLVSGHSEKFTKIPLTALLKAKELSRRFNNKVLTDLHKRQFESLDRLGRMERRIRRYVLDELSIESILSEIVDEICTLTATSTLVATNGDVVLSHNFQDPIENLEPLISLGNPFERPFHSEAMHIDFPNLFSHYVGFVRVVFVFEGEVWNLLLFRGEEIEEITWGHRPDLPQPTPLTHSSASPHTSFDSYVELRHGHCRSFTSNDIRTISTIARALSYG